MRTGEDGPFTIGEAARVSGVKVPTIRYYESIGLLPRPPRTEGGRRAYDGADLRRLAFIRHSRELGFEIEAIRTLLHLQDDPDQSCAAADAIARHRLEEVERRIAGLKALKTELERMIEGCAHGRVDQCRVIETLADHDLCRHDHHAPATAVPTH
ncbi:helix-turn-helix domain-containing protein [Ancylobacter sp. WKF20]|uniref:MerR family transcriptional regulator n=1 Tax=Ancylobacter sp. WKF20 TaxID=3039801 RepID=UPI00243446D9|nr:helix-turn-helix domain-containing protein [Ancylobacter sp. WKF20]WGD29206.1 helix-turn-helix domain-containing protein [Ancylobacter sp. WKF20]